MPAARSSVEDPKANSEVGRSERSYSGLGSRGQLMKPVVLSFCVCIALPCIAPAGTASAVGDLAARLRAARSLRCEYTSSVATWVRNGRPTVEQTKDKGSATYDDINLTMGTARIIGNIGAGDMRAWLDRQGALWMLERTPAGLEVTTTVFPTYAEGTNEFVVLESRHSMALTGQTVLGETAFGTCKVLE